ncbi:MAG: hypothetical protein IJK22_03330 [Bacteroidales bacterium]|nr:hypothetical protein [Bacteroidales bacterium]
MLKSRRNISSTTDPRSISERCDAPSGAGSTTPAAKPRRVVKPCRVVVEGVCQCGVMANGVRHHIMVDGVRPRRMMTDGVPPPVVASRRVMADGYGTPGISEICDIVSLRTNATVPVPYCIVTVPARYPITARYPVAAR